MKNVINWFALPSSDFNRAINFYSHVLGIEMMTIPSPDGFQNTFFSNPQNRGVSGAISSNPAIKPSAEGTTIYFDVNGRLDAILERVAQNGGHIAVAKTKIDEFGNIALVIDTEGNLIGFHSAS
ncbi:VOC family protein [Muricauda sp. JGD-17]|uniref:VOC family protein n=1 Tax=Flagellimonas ochracea TaxID=2696472 RepID=A0A964TEC7_9FLAO|nr:VOC family protein [Allomuricauda ochracea]NAY93387.1 VOC family protein [Allomuricauda ochracea]